MGKKTIRKIVKVPFNLFKFIVIQCDNDTILFNDKHNSPIMY